MNTRLLALIGLAPLIMTLAACEKTDTDLAMDFVNTWLESRGAMSKNKDGSYSPTLKGAAAATGWGTTGDDQADAAMQAGKVTKDIADNDKLVDQANEDLKKNPPDTKGAKEKLDKAVDNRPDDWYYRNRRAMYLVNAGDTAAARKDLQAGLEGCGGNQVCLAAVHKDRMGFYVGEQSRSFMTADPMRCIYTEMGVESFQALMDMSSGTQKEEYRKNLDAAKEQKARSCN